MKLSGLSMRVVRQGLGLSFWPDSPVRKRGKPRVELRSRAIGDQPHEGPVGVSTTALLVEKHLVVRAALAEPLRASSDVSGG